MCKMNVRVIAASLFVVGMTGAASAQYYPPPPPPGYGQPLYPPPGYVPPPGYATPPGSAPPGYRGRQVVDDDDDVGALPAPGPYGRPQGYQYNGPQYNGPQYNGPPRPPSVIQRDALPAPGQDPRDTYAPQYQDGAFSPPPARRDYGYAPPDQARPPGDVGPNAFPSPPSAAQPGGYAGLPPDYQPEVGKPKELPPQFRRQLVEFPTKEPAGTLIIDTPNTYLYLVLGSGRAMRYGIGVGREGFTWTGRERISRMSEWPDWHPPKEMIERQPYLPRFMAGGPSNPLGARALYLGNTLYRIHGTNQPSTIGSFVSSGCIRLVNDDIEDLFNRVQVGTRVVVLPGANQPPSATAAAPATAAR
jgi:lipoprotein-anchoring transpeptidase ErfK/SrfK